MRGGLCDLFKEHCPVSICMKTTFDGCQTACICYFKCLMGKKKISMRMSCSLFIGGRPVGHG